MAAYVGAVLCHMTTTHFMLELLGSIKLFLIYAKGFGQQHI